MIPPRPQPRPPLLPPLSTSLLPSPHCPRCIFHYSGAAAAAGASYRGAILASRSGAWPQAQADLDRMAGVLEGAGIKMWELR